MTATRRLAALLATVVALVAVSVSPARAAEIVSSVVVDAALGENGVLKVTTTLAFDGAGPVTVTQRLANTRDGSGTTVYSYDISQISVSVDGTPIANPASVADGYTVITVPVGSARSAVISYQVVGATVASQGGVVSFEWRVLQGLSVPVQEVSGQVAMPTTATEYTCQSGPPVDQGICSTFTAGTHGSTSLNFTDGPRGAGEVVVVGARFTSGVAVTERVGHRWSLDRAFTVGAPELIAALGTLLVGLGVLWLLHRRAGRDAAAAAPVTIAQFVPIGAGEAEFRLVEDLRPGVIGTLIDERVDPADILATLLDLAVRGHLLIVQNPAASSGITDWTLTRLESSDPVAPFELRLLDGIAPQGGSVQVSELSEPVVAAVAGVQDALYDDVVARGWFTRRPDATRHGWMRLGWLAVAVAVVAAVALVAWTTFGLLGLVLIAIGVGILVIAEEMPARTASGVSVVAGLQTLAAQLHVQPTDQLPRGRELGEVSRILPYAAVLGGVDRWLAALVASDTDEAADGDDLTWYHAGGDWHLRDLPASLDALTTAIRGRLFHRL